MFVKSWPKKCLATWFTPIEWLQSSLLRKSSSTKEILCVLQSRPATWFTLLSYCRADFCEHSATSAAECLCVLKSRLATWFAIWSYCRANFCKYLPVLRNFYTFSEVVPRLDLLNLVTVELTVAYIYQFCGISMRSPKSSHDLICLIKLQPTADRVG